MPPRTTTTATLFWQRRPDFLTDCSAALTAIASTSILPPSALRTVSTTTTTPSIGISVQRPNRLTAAYNEMQRQCPNEIAAYAACVQSHSDDLVQGTCQKEFDAVNECFRQARRRHRRSKQ